MKKFATNKSSRRTPITERTTGTIGLAEINRVGNVMIQLDTALLKVASRCNINCSYCYVYNMGDDGWLGMPKRMSEETLLATCAALTEVAELQGRSFAVVLHGGEPLLLGRDRLHLLLSTLRRMLPSETAISLQSNGLLLTSNLLEICSDHHVTISLSLDGPRNVHDGHRVTHDGRGTFDRVLAAVDLLRQHWNSDFLFSGLLAVVDPKSDPAEIYTFFNSLFFVRWHCPPY